MTASEPTAAEKWQDRDFQLGWLRCLVLAYEHEHDWAGDEDPSATHEMLDACRAIHDELVKAMGPRPDDPHAEAVKQNNDAIHF